MDVFPAPVDRWEIFEEEIKQISDSAIREWVKGLIAKLPHYFWIVPASISGKYHSPDDCVDGGLVHHTKKVVYFGAELCASFSIPESKDKVIAACILHDAVKYGMGDDRERGANKYDIHKIHPQNAEKWLLSHTPNPTPDQIEIGRMIACHSGPWGTTPDVFPHTKEEWVVHLADYVASRNKVVFRPFANSDYPIPAELGPGHV